MDANDLLLARRELELRKRQVELRRNNELAFFTPHAKQQQFFSHANYHYRYARTGNRFGKSEMGAAEDVAFALGFRPWVAEGDPLRTLGIPAHPTKGLIITTDWDKSTEVFTEREGANLGKLFKYIPADCVGSVTRNHSGAIDRILVKHVSGGWSAIHLDTVKSYKQNPLGQESSSWDWVHVDEPIPEQMWKAVARGLVDRMGRAWFTCTPITEPWIDGKFISDLSDQTKTNLGNIAQEKESRWMMTGSMDDNPTLTPEAIEHYMQDLTDDEREARRNGIPLAYSGIVYKEFNWSVHVKSDGPPEGWVDGLGNRSWIHPPMDYCNRFAIDYHFRKNDAVLFATVSPDGRIYIHHELWQQMLLEEQVKTIKEVYGFRPYQPGLIDPLASTPNKQSDLTAMDEYRLFGLPVLPATKDPINGIRAVKALLKARDKKGEPLVYISSECSRFLFEISRGFMWDGEENKPVKKNDDMMECFYRLVLHGLTYIEPTDLYDYSDLVGERVSPDYITIPPLTGWRDTTSKPNPYNTRYRI